MAQIDFGIGFKVDKTGLDQARAALEQISQLTRNEFAAMHPDLSTNEVKTQLTDIYNQANAVRDALSEAFNVKLNSINIDKFNQSLQASGTSIQQVYNSFKQAGPLGENAFRTLANQVTSTNIQLKQTHTFLNNIATTLTNTIKWNLASSAVNAMTRSVQDAFNFTKALDSSLNDIRIVTNKSAADMDNFAVKANNAAKALGTTTTEYTNAALTFYQQGLDDQAVETRARLSNMVANVTGLSGDDAAEYVTSILNGYKVTADAAEEALDKLANVGANTASSLQELAQGMSKVAASANMLGVSEDELASYLSTILSVTRADPNSVGTALKTIFARISDIETGAEDAEVSLGEYSGAMAELGFNVLDSSGHLRDLGDVMAEIGAGWGNLSREQQVYLAQTMAGTRQYSNLVALFDNWDQAQRALNFSMTANGTLQQQQNIYMERTTTHVKELTAQMEELYMHMIDTDSMNNVIDAITTLVDGLDGWMQSLGGMSGVLKTLGTLGVMVFADQIGKSINTAASNMMIARSNMLEVEKVLNKLSEIKSFSGLDSYTQQLANMKEDFYGLSKVMSPEAFNAIRDQLNQFVVDANKVGEIQAMKENLQGLFDQLNIGKDKVDQFNFDNFFDQEAKFDEEVDVLREKLQNLKDVFSQPIDFSNIQVDVETVTSPLDQLTEKINALNINKGSFTTQVGTELKDFLAQFTDGDTVNVVNMLDTLNNKINEIKQGNPNAKTNNLEKLAQLLREVADEASHTSVNLSELADKSNAEAFEEGSDEAKAFGNALEDCNNRITKYKQEIKDAGEAGTLTASDTKRMTAEIEQAKKAIEALGAASPKTAAELQKIMSNLDFNLKTDTSSFIGRLNKNVADLSKQYDELGISVSSALKQAQSQAELTGQSIKQALGEIAREEYIASLVRMTGAMTSIFNAFSSIKNLGSIWNNEDLSEGERMYQIFTSLLTIATQLGMGYNALSKASKAFSSSLRTMRTANEMVVRTENEMAEASEGAAVAEEHHTQAVERNAAASSGAAAGTETLAGAEQRQGVAAEEASVAQNQLNTSINMFPLMWIVTAIGLAIGAYSMYTNAIKESIDAAHESATKVQERNQEIQEESQEIKTLVDDYEHAYETFIKTGEGRDALNDSIQNLCDKYDIEISKLDLLAGRYEDVNAEIAEHLRLSAEADLVEAVNSKTQLRADLLTATQEDKHKVFGTTNDVSDFAKAGDRFIELGSGGAFGKGLEMTGYDPAFEYFRDFIETSKVFGTKDNIKNFSDNEYTNGNFFATSLVYAKDDIEQAYSEVVNFIDLLSETLSPEELSESRIYEPLQKWVAQYSDFADALEGADATVQDAASRIAMSQVMSSALAVDPTKAMNLSEYDAMMAEAVDTAKQSTIEILREKGIFPDEESLMAYIDTIDWEKAVSSYFDGFNETFDEYAEKSAIGDEMVKKIFSPFSESDLQAIVGSENVPTESELKEFLDKRFGLENLQQIATLGFEFSPYVSPQSIDKAIELAHGIAQTSADSQTPVIIKTAIASIADKGDLSSLSDDERELFEESLKATDGINGMTDAWSEFQMASAGGTLAALEYLNELNQQQLIGRATFNGETREALEQRAEDLFVSDQPLVFSEGYKTEYEWINEDTATDELLAQRAARERRLQEILDEQVTLDSIIPVSEDISFGLNNIDEAFGWGFLLEQWNKINSSAEDSRATINSLSDDIANLTDKELEYLGYIGEETLANKTLYLDQTTHSVDYDTLRAAKTASFNALENRKALEDELGFTEEDHQRFVDMFLNLGTDVQQAFVEGLSNINNNSNVDAFYESIKQNYGITPEQWSEFLLSPIATMPTEIADVALQGQIRRDMISIMADTGVGAAEAYNKALANKMNELANGTVDLLARPVIKAQDLINAGWEDEIYDADLLSNSDAIATLYSQTIDATNFEGEDLHLNENVILDLTPIREDGSVLSPEELDDYAKELLGFDNLEDILANDTQHLVINAQVLPEVSPNFEIDYDAVHAEHEENMNTIHNLQDAYYNEQYQVGDLAEISTLQSEIAQIETELQRRGVDLNALTQERLDEQESRAQEIYEQLVENSEYELSAGEKLIAQKQANLQAEEEMYRSLAEDQQKYYEDAMGGFGDTSFAQTPEHDELFESIRDQGEDASEEDRAWADTYEEIASAASDAKEAVDEYTEAAQAARDTLDGTDWGLESLLTNVDNIETAAEGILGIGDAISEAASLIGDGFVVAADDAERLAEIMPELFQTDNIEEYTSEGIRLNAELTNSILAGKQQQLNADTATSIAEIDNLITEAEAEAAAAQAEADIWAAQQEAVANGQITADQAVLNAEKQLMGDQLNDQQLLADAKQRVANAEVEMAKQSTTQQGDAYSIIGKNSNTAFSTASANAQSAAGVLTANAQQVVRAWNQAWKSVQNGTGVAVGGPVGGYAGSDGSYEVASGLNGVNVDVGNLSGSQLLDANVQISKFKADQANAALAKLRALRAKLLANQANAAKAVGGAGKGSGSKGSGGGGGGGGSSNKDEEAEQIDLLEDESDIYHDINIQIQQLEDELKDLQRVEETFTGKDLIDNLNKQLEVMEKQRDTLAEKIEIAKQEADIYRTALEDYGATFDANGEITNYFNLLQDQLEKTNDVIERYNNLSAEQQTDEEKKKVEDAQQQYDDLLSIIEAYEKVINDTIPKLEDEIQEKLLDEIELQIQKFNMEVELRLDMREAAEDWNEFKRKVIDDLDDDSLTGKAQEAFDNILSYYDTAGSGEGVIGSEMQHIQDILGELAKMDAGSHSDVYSAYDDTLGVWIDDRATAMEDLKNAYDELSEALEEVKDLEDEVHEAFLDSIDATKDAYDSQADQFEFVQDQLEHDIDLIEQLYGDDAYDRMAEFYDKQAQLAQQSVASRQQEVNYWKRLMDAEQEAVLNGAGDKEALAAYTENWQDALDQLNESIETWAEAMTETYKNTISGVIQELNNQITNGLGLDYVGEEFELMKDNMDDYLDAINSAYALDDLRNKWQDAINGTDDLAIQQQLSDMMQHQLDMLERKGELTQYDIDRAEKEYEIALKQIALQEAQQNKTKMRLRRDANGNYSYQFVSDEDEMRQAQQELAAAQNELYNFDKGAYQDNLNEMYSTWNEFQEKIADAYVTYADDQDALNEHIAMLQEQYQEKINRLTEQNLNIRNNLYSSAFDEMADLYDVDISNFENMTQQEKDLIMSDLIPTWEAGVQQMIDTFAGDGGFGPAVEEIFDQLDQAAQNYVDRMLEISDVNQQISEEAFDEMDQILDFSDQLIEAAQSEYEAIQDVLEQVRELAQAYAQAKEEAVSATTAAYSYWQQEQAKAAEASAKENANISAASTPTSGTASGSGSDTTPAAGNSTTAGSGAETPSSEAAQEPAAAAPQKIRVPKSGVHAAVAIQFWEGGNGNWGTGGTRRSRCNELGIDYNYAQHTFADKLNGGTKSKMLSKVKSLGANMSGINLNDFRYDNYKKNRDKYEMYKTGGYTGEWVGRDGKFAMLHQRELVLNEEDTSNILLAVEAMRNVTKTIDANMLNSMTSLLTGFGAYGGGFGSPSQTLDQNVHIDAHFPNVQNSREIEDAFNNLVNIASQRAFRNKRGS